MASCSMLSAKPRPVMSCMMVSKRTAPPPAPARRWTALNTMSRGSPDSRWHLVQPASACPAGLRWRRTQ
eukprot:5937153-Lingulodinium_polyedra.AAC.1